MMYSHHRRKPRPFPFGDSYADSGPCLETIYSLVTHFVSACQSYFFKKNNQLKKRNQKETQSKQQTLCQLFVVV